MKKFKIGLIALSVGVLLTGCSNEEGNDNSDSKDMLSCTLVEEARGIDYVVDVNFDGDEVTGAEMVFILDSSSSSQTAVDTICENYTDYQGAKECVGTPIDEGSAKYEIVTEGSEDTLEFLEFKEDVVGTNYDEIKASFEDNGYTCK